MPRREPETIVLRTDERAGILASMAEVDRGGGWITLQPGFDADSPEAEAAGTRVRSRAPAVPVCTWVPGERSRRLGEYVALGIEHGTGSKVASRLAERGVAVPEPWTVIQDNPRRGLVVAAGPADPHDDVLVWLLQAGASLSLVPLTGEWRALVYRR